MDERNKKSTALWRLVGGLAVSAVLLTVIQAPWNVHFLAWAAWVPFILVCEPKASGKRLAAAAFVVALGYWLFNLSWLMPVTGPGYVVFAMWQALYWPVLALVTRFVRKKHWPMVVFAPVLFVGAEAIQSVLFTGFNWFFLAHSQYRILGLIQICDIFGQLAISVLVAMVNGLIVDGICAVRRTILGGAFWEDCCGRWAPATSGMGPGGRANPAHVEEAVGRLGSAQCLPTSKNAPKTLRFYWKIHRRAKYV